MTPAVAKTPAVPKTLAEAAAARTRTDAAARTRADASCSKDGSSRKSASKDASGCEDSYDEREPKTAPIPSYIQFRKNLAKLFIFLAWVGIAVTEICNINGGSEVLILRVRKKLIANWASTLILTGNLPDLPIAELTIADHSIMHNLDMLHIPS